MNVPPTLVVEPVGNELIGNRLGLATNFVEQLRLSQLVDSAEKFHMLGII